MSWKLGTTTFPHGCDTCGFAASGVYCPTHSAFLCHHRVPVLPIEELNHCIGDGEDEDDDVAEAASWLVLNPQNICGDDDGLGLVFGGKVEETENGFCDVRSDDAQMRFEMGLGFAHSSKPAYGNGSVPQSVSISSTNVKSVPESTISEVSISDSNPAICTTLDLSSAPPILMPSYLSYREARVQRYKEKKKTRKFEKKIRYASRKIYAEIRPRIKGRFAKRTNNVEVEMDHVLSSTIITEAGYSVVPYF